MAIDQRKDRTKALDRRSFLSEAALGAMSVGLGGLSANTPSLSATDVLPGQTLERNRFYVEMRPPLLPTRFVKLPLGSVRPIGWLRTQLTIQSNGLTGHLDEFVLTDSEWKGGKGFKLQGPPYRYTANYLEGLVPLAYLLDDQRLRAKAKPYIEWILSSAKPDGWFCTPRKDGDEEGATPNPEYLSLILKMLINYYEVTGDARVVPLARNYFKYLDEHIQEWPAALWWGNRAMEHALAAYWLYNHTGDPAILASLGKIHQNSYDWTAFFASFPWDDRALAEKRIPHKWDAAGKTAHNVAIACAVKFPALWHLMSQRENDLQASFQAIDNLDRYHGQAGGRFSGDEHLAGRRPTQGLELCGVVEYMYSLEKILEISGKVSVADRLELLAFNSLPGTMTPDCWAHQYDQQSNQVLVSSAARDWTSNGNESNLYGLMPNYPCCMGNLHQGWPRLVEHMWMATHDQGLAALLFGPCRITARVAGGMQVTITEETDYPFDGAIRFHISTPQPVSFPLCFRIPAWAEGASLRWRGGKSNPSAGTYARIENVWKAGDTVELQLPMRVRAETRFNHSVSLLRGPLYFSLRIGKKYQKLKSWNYLGAADWAIEPMTAWNYAIQVDRDDPGHDVQAVRNAIDDFPFADKGDPIYADKQPAGSSSYEQSPPVVLLAKGRRLTQWGLKDNSADDPPVSPASSDQPQESLELVPYGCARLRITEFPVLGGEKST